MSGIMVVTGASRGIGAATARLAAQRGFDVAVNYNRAEGPAQEVVADAKAKGVRAVAIQADVAKEDDVKRLFATTERELGRPTALVNNAGTVGAFGRVEEVDADMLRALLDLNVVASFVCAREAIRRMSTRHGGAGGVIVNVSSIASRLGNADTWVWYAASKGAIDAFTLGLAREVGGEGIRVNAVAPGLIDTEIHAPAGGRERIASQVASVPLGRVGTPEDVAECILWLASPASAYVNGAILEVGGGR
jgi:NAD(P)-dependent dehydrogenase (short-subunit alcohol dehydrogenase family)